jgi:hypothetical protein
MDASQTMRAMLATEGIFLDEQAAPVAATSSRPTCDAPIDRALIREILSDRAAPDRDLDWLVESCPSVDHALAFEPTPWMQRGADDFTNFLAT